MKTVGRMVVFGLVIVFCTNCSDSRKTSGPDAGVKPLLADRVAPGRLALRPDSQRAVAIARPIVNQPLVCPVDGVISNNQLVAEGILPPSQPETRVVALHLPPGQSLQAPRQAQMAVAQHATLRHGDGNTGVQTAVPVFHPVGSISRAVALSNTNGLSLARGRVMGVSLSPRIVLTRKLDNGVFASFSSHSPKNERFNKYGGLFSYELEQKRDTNTLSGRLFLSEGMFALYCSQYDTTNGLRECRRVELNQASTAHRKLAQEFSRLPPGVDVWSVWQPSGFSENKEGLPVASDLVKCDVISFNSHDFAVNSSRLVVPYIAAISALLEKDNEVHDLMTDDGVYDLQLLRDLLAELSAGGSNPSRMDSVLLLGFDPIYQMATMQLGWRQYQPDEDGPGNREMLRDIRVHVLINTEKGQVLDIAVVATRMMRLPYQR